jgi:replication fork protection complex subunit Csm3/Swi3
MVEKMGHKKRLQMARMDWINEGKPHSSVHEESLFDEPTLPTDKSTERNGSVSRVAPIFDKPATERPKTPQADADAKMEDLYDATPKSSRLAPVTQEQNSIFGGGAGAPSIFGPAEGVVIDDGPPEDDLDALLAEEEAIQAEKAKAQQTSSKESKPQEDNFDDDMEAMAEMDDMW